MRAAHAQSDNCQLPSRGVLEAGAAVGPHASHRTPACPLLEVFHAEGHHHLPVHLPGLPQNCPDVAAATVRRRPLPSVLRGGFEEYP